MRNQKILVNDTYTVVVGKISKYNITRSRNINPKNIYV